MRKVLSERASTGFKDADAGSVVALRDWECVARIPVGNASGVGGIAFHPSSPVLAVKDKNTRRIDCYTFDYSLLDGMSVRSASRRYVNAKVVLLGDTGVGKSGLGLVLSGQEYQATDSTHGRRVWTFDNREIDGPGTGKQTREVLLWDLAGQPGYGASGVGPFQELEVESLVAEFVKRGKPIIPVILEGRRGNPRLPVFLNSCHKVDMRNPDPDPFEQLIWGITGEK